MAKISMDNGQSVRDVAELSSDEVALAIENTTREDDELREAAHAACTSDRDYLERFCVAYEARHGQAYALP